MTSLPPISSKIFKGVNKTLISLKKEDESSLVTEDQATNLSSLKFKNDEFILTMEDRNFLYEVVWMLNELGYDITYNFLSADWEKVLGSYNIRKRMLFENPLLDEARNKFDRDMNIYKTQVTVESGEKCRKCGSINTISITSYQRSSDEAPIIKIICLDCKYRWNTQ